MDQVFARALLDPVEDDAVVAVDDDRVVQRPAIAASD
jgi:hypothetical protein